jgi:hypothetical protein
MTNGNKKAVEILCNEIEFPYTNDLELPEVLVSFVVILVGHVRRMREMQVATVRMTKKPPSASSEEVLELVEHMLSMDDIALMRDRASEINTSLCLDELNCDHLEDMLSSCVSAIQFGLEEPCMSRHAASAADYIWKRMYGVSMFDRHTSKWSKDWTRVQLQEVIERLEIK